jgi:hypothetical protein
MLSNVTKVKKIFFFETKPMKWLQEKNGTYLLRWETVKNDWDYFIFDIFVPCISCASFFAFGLLIVNFMLIINVKFLIIRKFLIRKKNLAHLFSPFSYSRLKFCRRSSNFDPDLRSVRATRWFTSTRKKERSVYAPGWPDWANFLPMEGCFLWAVF